MIFRQPKATKDWCHDNIGKAELIKIKTSKLLTIETGGLRPDRPACGLA
jgi:hypothetical protein